MPNELVECWAWTTLKRKLKIVRNLHESSFALIRTIRSFSS